MADVILKRTESSESGTFGVLLMNDKQIAVTAERPWLDNQSGISCIPLGSYQVIKHDSPAHPDTWEITGVPNRSSILIHNGSYPLIDTEGCVLIAKERIGNIISGSVITLEYLRTILPDTFTLNIIFPLQVVNNDIQEESK